MTCAHADATTQSEAFEAMVSPHLGALSALAWQLTRDAVHTEDLVQETLLKAYRFLHRFELGTNFRAWLMTMMRHLYFSQLRKQAREVLTEHLEYIPASEPPELEADDEDDADRLATLNDALPHVVSDEVYNALNEVPETYRTAVLVGGCARLLLQGDGRYHGLPHRHCDEPALSRPAKAPGASATLRHGARLHPQRDRRFIPRLGGR